MNSTLMAIAIVVCGSGGNNKLAVDLTEEQIRAFVIRQKEVEYANAKEAVKRAPAHLEGAVGREKSQIKREKAKSTLFLDDYEKNTKLLENVKSGKSKIPADWVESIKFKKLIVDQTYAPATFIGKV